MTLYYSSSFNFSKRTLEDNKSPYPLSTKSTKRMIIIQSEVLGRVVTISTTPDTEFD